jgi:putative flippase GtrA
MPLPLPLETLRARVTDAWQRRAVSLKALSFATVGLINTAVDATIFFLMLGFVTSSLIVANVSAWLVAVTGSYVMNSFTTFSAETGGKLRLKDYLGFVASGLVAVSATTVTVLLVDMFLPTWAPWTAETRLGNITVATAIAKGVAILVSFVVNFSITHFVVFRARPGEMGERR